ncbi:MAG TPA: DUF1376 domain-containing protein [Actinomycetota bacterium]|nr:DUF1376 domain-containing protein [Actinomycetota bacterium]
MAAADPAPKVDVWMPWYVSDYLTSTALFSTLESGAYSLLLMHMWEQGGTLPLDHERLARAARVTDPDAWASIWREISVRFVPAGNGRITHPKLMAKLQEARQLKAEASDRGRAGAAGRWGKTRKSRARQPRPAPQQQEAAPAAPPPAADAGAHARAMPEQCSSPSPSPSPDVPDPERARAPAEPEPETGAWPEPKREPIRFNHGAVTRARGQPPPASRQMRLGAPRMCDFHDGGRNIGQPAIPPRDACAECQRIRAHRQAARASPRPASRPQGAGEVLGAGGWPPREPWPDRETDRQEGRA